MGKLDWKERTELNPHSHEEMGHVWKAEAGDRYSSHPRHKTESLQYMHLDVGFAMLVDLFGRIYIEKKWFIWKTF